MKSASLHFTILLLALILNSTAMASSIHQNALENDSLDLVVPLSPSKIEAEVQNEQIQRDRANQARTTIEGGISTWLPSQLQTPSRLPNPTAYTGTGVPALNINVLNPIGNSLNLKIGAGLLLTHRYADLNAIGLTQSEEETASIISARLGVEYLNAKISTPVFRPYINAAILPTVVLTNRTALDAGGNYFGFPVELGVGSLVAITKTFGFNFGVTETLGSINQSKISGLGANAMVRLPL